MPNNVVRARLNFPDLDLTSQINKVANQVIIPDIQIRINRSVDINGKSYPELAESTKKARNKRGQGFLPLKATGQLRASVRAKTITNGVKIILFGGRRDNITNKGLATILQQRGVRSKAHGKRKFKFFGISKEAEKESMSMVSSQIRKAIRDGRRKFSK